MPDTATIHVTSTQLHSLAKGMDLSEIRVHVPHLEDLCREKNDRATDFNEGVKAVAEKAGVKPAVLAAYINAVVKDTVKAKQEQAEQLQILFEELA